MSIEAWMTRGETLLGKTWRARIKASCTPMERADSTYSSSLVTSTEARRMRVYQGNQEMAMAMRPFHKLRSRAAARAMGNNRGGKARRMSVARIMTSSTRPP